MAAAKETCPIWKRCKVSKLVSRVSVSHAKHCIEMMSQIGGLGGPGNMFSKMMGALGNR